MTNFLGTKGVPTFALAAALISAPYTAFAAEEVRNLDGFTAVHVGGSMDVQVKAGESFSVVVVADAEDLERITTEVRDGALRVGMERGNWHRNRHGRMLVKVSMPALNRVAVSGSGDLWASGINSDALEVDVRGSGDAELSGTAKTCDVDTRGSGDIEAEDLTCGDSSVTSQGSSDISLTVNGEVSIDVNGSGDVDLYGDARIVELRSRGSGDISIKN